MMLKNSMTGFFIEVGKNHERTYAGLRIVNTRGLLRMTRKQNYKRREMM